MEHWLPQSNIKETILMDQHLYIYCQWNGDCDCNGTAKVILLLKFWSNSFEYPPCLLFQKLDWFLSNSTNLPFLSMRCCWFDLARNGRNGVDCFYKSQIRRIWPPSTRCPAERFQNTSQIETETQSLDIGHYRGDKRTGWHAELWHNCDNIPPWCHITSSVQSFFGSDRSSRNANVCPSVWFKFVKSIQFQICTFSIWSSQRVIWVLNTRHIVGA